MEQPWKKNGKRARKVSDDMDITPEIPVQVTRNILYFNDLGECNDEAEEYKDDRLKTLLKLNCEEQQFYFEIGFNMFIYGVGSRREYIKEFVLNYSKTGNYLWVVMNGYHSCAMLKSMLNNITTRLNRLITAIPAN